MKKLFWLLLLTHVCTFAALSQTTLAGRVAEVTDGRTLVVETNTGRIVAQLQYIEVPEAEQPLHKVVTDHLSKIALGKNVEFKLLRLVGGKTIGLLTMDGVDLSAQMIRDGGAW